MASREKCGRLRNEVGEGVGAGEDEGTGDGEGEGDGLGVGDEAMTTGSRPAVSASAGGRRRLLFWLKTGGVARFWSAEALRFGTFWVISPPLMPAADKKMTGLSQKKPAQLLCRSEEVMIRLRPAGAGTCSRK